MNRSSLIFELLALFVIIFVVLPVKVALRLFASIVAFRRVILPALYLLRRRNLSTYVEMYLEKSLGNFHIKHSLLLIVLQDVEQHVTGENAEPSVIGREVLIHLYQEAFKSFAEAGNLDSMANLVIRAHFLLGITSIPGLGELDLQAAHIIRAGLQATRIINGAIPNNKGYKIIEGTSRAGSAKDQKHRKPRGNSEKPYESKDGNVFTLRPR